MRRVTSWAALAALLAFVPPARAADESLETAGRMMAGAAVVDATWHVGASSGQYASEGFPLGPDHADPTLHSTRRATSYGVQSRLNVRALVVADKHGRRVAIVKDDLYIPQDLLRRRAVQILEQGESRIGDENLVLAVTHNHSSPYYSSPAWGLWAFQDVFDVRFYEYYAQRIAEAVERAAKRLQPVRVSAAVTELDKPHRHSFGPAVADDGTPAGYPVSDADHDLTVVRFDETRVKEHPRPIATLVNYSLHPEFLEGNDLISGDYIAPLQRMVDRATGGITVFTQNAVGTAEPERSTYHSVHERLEFTHREYAQAEHGARLIADAVLAATRAAGGAEVKGITRRVGPFLDGEVRMIDRWLPGPLSHPLPTVSNCRTDKAFKGDPQVPVVGLPDCNSVLGGAGSVADLLGLPEPPPAPASPIDPGVDTDDLQAAGIAVPENYGVTGFTGLEENFNVHLQALAIGPILFTVCACEQWADQSRNIKTRTNRQQGDMYLGYDWSAGCEPAGGGTWSCPDPRSPGKSLPPVEDRLYQRMRAQVLNDAKGWDDPENVLTAESEPADPAQIKGNFTHEELPPERGWELTVPISMANDYNGYIASYREYQRGDHYRKALTAWGPHSADYLATNLVSLAGELAGAAPAPTSPLAAKVALGLAVADAEAASLGRLGGLALAAYEENLPDDGGAAEAVAQPADVERFAAAFFTWNGGSNYTDQPVVKVQRFTQGRWVDFADQSGEIPVTLALPKPGDLPGYYGGGQRWHWTAHFEAFSSPIDVGWEARGTPASKYRFAVRGMRREGGRPVPYELTSAEFRIRPWQGITVEDLGVGPSGRVAFRVGPSRERSTGEGEAKLVARIGPIDYPDSYESPARFVRLRHTAIADPESPKDPSKLEWYCFTCRFRPWVDFADARTATVTIVRRGSRRTRRVRAVPRGNGLWITRTRLRRGETAYVAAGGVKDAWGNLNGRESARVTRP